MKILMPWYDYMNHSINDPRVTNGVSMFMKNFYKEIDNVHLVEIENNIESARCVNFQRRSRDILNRAITQIEPDLIVVNHAMGLFCGPKIQKFGVPILLFNHTLPYVLSRVHLVRRLNEEGHTVCFMSDWQLDFWNDKARKSSGPPLRSDMFISPAFCTGRKPKLREIEYDCVTVGRNSKLKDPFKMKRLLPEDVKSLVITTNPQKTVDMRYYQKYSHYDDIMINIPHNQVIQEISKSRTYFSTWDKETWGITSLEALSCGVPVILNGRDGKHASTIIPASDSHMRVIGLNNPEDLLSAVNQDWPSRQEIQDMTWEKHSKKEWIRTIHNAMDLALFKKKTVGRLLFV